MKTFRLPRKKKKQLRKLNASLTLRIIELSKRLQNLKGLRNEPSIPPTFILDIASIEVIDYLKDWCKNLDVAAERKALPELFTLESKPDRLKLSTGSGFMFDSGQMQLLHNSSFYPI